MRRWTGHIGAFVAGLVVAAALGALADRAPARGRRAARFDVLAQALSYIENNYVDPVDETALVYGAVRGMVDRLDGFSAFLPPRDYARLRQDTEGRYAGVGVSVTPDDDGVPVIEEVMPGSPAERAELRAGDRVVAVDDAATAGGAWHGSLRGAPGTAVTLTVERTGWRDPRRIRLVRAAIEIPSVSTRTLDGDVAYIRVRQFQRGTAAAVRAALRRARSRAGGVVPALVLDLRGNPGGVFDEAVAVADLFLPSGTIVTVRGRGGQLERPQARRAATWSGFPMAVLLDGRSASSAEIVAGALHDHGRAVLVGATSYGKGSVQSLLDLEDGSGLKLTTARYETPAGRSIEGRGIEPDVEVGAAADPLEIAYQTLRGLALSKERTQK